MMISHASARRAILTALAVATVAVSGSAANGRSSPDWKSFSIADQGLSVSMPGTPKTKVIGTKSFIGLLTTHEYFVDDSRDSYSIEFTDLPGFAVAFSGSQVIYEHAKGALLKQTLSKVISFTDITLNGVQGKKLVYDTPSKPDHPEMQGEARLFLSADRLYIADAVVEMQGGNAKLNEFFSSLEIRR